MYWPWKKKTQDIKQLERLHEQCKQVVRLHKKSLKVMQIVAMTGLSYPTVRATIDLFDAGGWAGIRPVFGGSLV